MEIWFRPPIAPTIVDIIIILSVEVFISIRYDININGAVFCIIVSSTQFSHLNVCTRIEAEASILVQSTDITRTSYTTCRLCSAS
jgi:hypothetical protein